MDNLVETVEPRKKDDRERIVAPTERQETLLKEKSLAVWGRTNPWDASSFVNRVNSLRVDRGRDFDDRVGYLQDEIKDLPRTRQNNVKLDQLLKVFSNKDPEFIHRVCERILNPEDKLAVTDPTINDFAYMIGRYYYKEGEVDLPPLMGLKGTVFQRVLTYSFLNLTPEQMFQNMDDLIKATEFSVAVLNRGKVDHQKLRKVMFGLILGAAASAVSLTTAKQFLGDGNSYLSPASDYLDFYSGIDGFVWKDGVVHATVQSATQRFAALEKEWKDYPKVSHVFDGGKVFYTVLAPFDTASLARKVENEMGSKKLLKFLKGSSMLTNLPGDFYAFYHLVNFKSVSDSINRGEYPLDSFARDIAEFIQAAKNESGRRSAAA